MKALTFEKLTAAEAAELNMALALTGAGAKVTIAVTYEKVGKSKARVADKDYVALPGVAADVLLGTVTVKEGKAHGAYLLVDSITRATGDPTEHGWTALRPEGIKTAKVVRIDLPHVAPKAEAMSDALMGEKSEKTEKAPEVEKVV
jgi:hypothetical protein